MLEGRNPFPYGPDLSADELVDREAELEAVESTIRNGGKLLLFGPRRFGKTSILAAAEEAARTRGVMVLRVDAERYESLEWLAQAIMTAAARQLRAPLERAAALISEVATRLRPELSIDPAGTMSVTLGLRPPEVGEVPLLSDALDAVERLAGRSDREVAVILDEVQAIVVEHGPTAEGQLRATVQRHRHLSYVFAGSATRLLSEMTDDPNRPFYRLGARLFIGKIPRDAFHGFLIQAFEDTGASVRTGGADEILDLAEEVPYNVQRLAHETWELLRPLDTPTLEPDAVRQALRQLVEKEDPAYSLLWSGLTKNQKKTIKAVIVTGGAELLSADVSRRFGIPSSSVQRALEQLESTQLLWRQAERGSIRYRLVDPFLARWIEAHQAG